MIINFHNKSINNWDWYAINEQKSIICVAGIQVYKLTFFLRNVYCVPEHRCKGYATQLIKHIQKKYAKILLDCPTSLCKFYEKTGFTKVGTRSIKGKKYIRMTYND